MNKVELIAKYAVLQNTSKKEAEEQVNTFLKVMEYGLEKDGVIKFSEYFQMEVVKTNPRTGRNPQTGEAVEIPAGHKIKCKFLKRLKDVAKNYSK